MRRIVTSVMDIFRDGIVDIMNPSACHGQTADGGEKTLRHAVNGIVRLRIAEFGGNVAMAQNNAVSRSPLLRQRTERYAKRPHLVFIEIPLAAMLLGIIYGGTKFRRVEAQFGGRSFLPRAGRRKVRGGGLSLRDSPCADEGQKESDSFHTVSVRIIPLL